MSNNTLNKKRKDPMAKLIVIAVLMAVLICVARSAAVGSASSLFFSAVVKSSVESCLPSTLFTFSLNIWLITAEV